MSGPAYVDPFARPTAVQIAAWIRCADDDTIPAVVAYLEGLLAAADQVDCILLRRMVVIGEEELYRLTHPTDTTEGTS